MPTVKAEPRVGKVQPVGSQNLRHSAIRCGKSGISLRGDVKIIGSAEIILGARSANAGEIPIAVEEEFDPEQFGAQASRCRKALDALRLSKGTDKVAFKQVLESARMSEVEKKAYEEHSTGTVVIQPFYEKLIEYLDGQD